MTIYFVWFMYIYIYILIFWHYVTYVRMYLKNTKKIFFFLIILVPCENQAKSNKSMLYLVNEILLFPTNLSRNDGASTVKNASSSSLANDLRERGSKGCIYLRIFFFSELQYKDSDSCNVAWRSSLILISACKAHVGMDSTLKVKVGVSRHVDMKPSQACSRTREQP